MLGLSRKDYAHFISISLGSTAELETLLLLAERTGLLSSETTAPIHEQVDHLGRMLNKLRSRLLGDA
jgi:four helix bundle protein